MVHGERHRRSSGLYVLVAVGIAISSASVAFSVQAPHEVPATHERQCVPTGEIPAGDARTITVTWKHPFATGEYGIVGSVSEPGDSSHAIELSHIVIPHTARTAAAVVLNRNAEAAQAGVLCLDASAE